MRRIEEAMTDAIRDRRSWLSGNTSVSFLGPEERCAVYLYGNRIASGTPDALEVDLQTFRRWPTATTVSRLVALGFRASRTGGVARLNGNPV